VEGIVVEGPAEVLNDRYELRGLIGRGGMAEVHRGFDRVLQRDVAVKMMHVALSQTRERHRFTAETQLLASLNDPHLVTLLDTGVDETGPAPRPWFVMELVAGPSLADILLDGPLDRAEAARVGAGIARALAHVHALGIVHRDVKPANVLLTPSGSAKLADFGVARAIGGHHSLTQTGYAVGTAAYLAPEQVTGEPVTVASDVYALGLVLLEALTGGRAYSGTPQEMGLARLHHSPTIPVSLGAPWTRLLAQMTALDPADRPEAAEVAERLRALDVGSDQAPAMEVIDADAAPTGQWASGAARSGVPVVIRAMVALVATLLVTATLAWAIHRPSDSLPTASAAGVSSEMKHTGSRSRSARNAQSLPSTSDTPAANAPTSAAVSVVHHTVRHRVHRAPTRHPRPSGRHRGHAPRPSHAAPHHAPHPPAHHPHPHPNGHGPHHPRPHKPHKPHKPHHG
jgi:serine/threonine protein kinase